MKISLGCILIIWVVICQPLFSQNLSVLDCSARFDQGILTIENSKISRSYEWNNGNLITRSITDKVNNKVWQMNGLMPDLALPGEIELATNATFISKAMPETSISPKHLQVEVIYNLDKLKVKRIFRIYANCPAIACDLYLSGESNNVWVQPRMNIADMVNLEKNANGQVANSVPVIEKLDLSGRHWQINAIEFFDITDRFNTLVKDVNALSYRPNFYRGNLLLAHNSVSNDGVFLLKESPTSNVQLDYPGSDFITEYGTFRVIGIGISSSDLDKIEWKRAYGFVAGVYSGDKYNGLLALRNYQKSLRLHKPGRDEMVMMNTWGDRGQDTWVRERFALAELEAGAKLGISHFQLDDGWQTGRSANSAFTGGSFESIWDKPNYWMPNSEKFPNGLEPLINKGKELGIKVCLWFNPSPDNSNQNWEKDANALIGLYKKHGISTFKIDGVKLPDKTSELNFRKFLEKINEATDYNVVFNLDVTAGRRGGYNYFNEYGNLFLENRYTDWQNYYPYTTLRNLWMLSKYVPAENLQIEFLNKWRNAEIYTNDPFAPANYSFEYLFAITMAAQPLAWFEGTGLPDGAIEGIAPVIKKYREIQHDLHNGSIFPIGDEPSGKSWTGFQSIKDDSGYFIVFREANDSSSAEIKTWLKSGTMVKCTPVIGAGEPFSVQVAAEGKVSFQLKDKNSYVLYKYAIQ